MDFLANVLIETSRVLYEGSLYILIGFFIAGLLHEFLPTDAIAHYFGRDDPKSVTLAALFGAPIPLCSCGVLPAAAALRQKGASRSSLMSFLISTPETGVDSIALTYGLLGPAMAILRPLVAVLTAIVAGLISVVMPADVDNDETAADTHAHGHKPHDDDANVQLPGVPANEPVDFASRMHRIISYGFGTLLDEIAFWMLLGIVLTGLMAAALPNGFFSTALGLDRGLLPMILMIIAGTPLYLCASASTPVAAALLAKGLSPGAALVFLLVGPATNATTMSVVGRLLGGRRLRVYLFTIIGVSLAAGLAVDEFGGQAFRATAFSRAMTPGYDFMSLVKLATAFIFAALLWTSLRRTGMGEGLAELREQFSRIGSGLRDFRWRLLVGPRALATAAVVLIAATIPRLALVVEPGQRGIVQRFGKVVAADLKPGLHWHLPAPLGRGTAVDFDRVRRVRVGFEETARGGRLVVASEALYLTADENIIDIRSVVTYRVIDSTRFALGMEKADALVRGLARRSLVDIVATRTIDKLYTTERRNAESDYRKNLVHLTRDHDLGIEIVDAQFLDVHAPSEVHAAFRDVASALEDKVTDTYVARGYALEKQHEADGRADEITEAASGDAAKVRESAVGRSDAFGELRKARATAPRLTDYRLTLETMDRALTGTRKYIHDTRYRAADIDLWLGFGALAPTGRSSLNGIPIEKPASGGAPTPADRGN